MTASKVYNRSDRYNVKLSKWERVAAMPTGLHAHYPVAYNGQVYFATAGIKGGTSTSNLFLNYIPGV